MKIIYVLIYLLLISTAQADTKKKNLTEKMSETSEKIGEKKKNFDKENKTLTDLFKNIFKKK